MTSPAAVSPQPPVSESSGKGLPPRGQQQAGSNFGRDRDRGGFGHRGDRENRDNRRDIPRERLTSRSSNATANDDTGSIDGDNARPRPINIYPDNHQLFVGNLPHTVTIGEIKVFELNSIHGLV